MAVAHSLLILLVFAAAAVYSYEGPFYYLSVNDLDLNKASFYTVTNITLPKCARVCVGLDTKCSGFYFLRHKCYLLKFGRTWSERYAFSAKRVYIKPNGRSPKCERCFFRESWGRSRYAFITERKTWREAAAHCEKMGAKLLEISSQAELSFVQQNILRGKGDKFVYAGMQQMPGARSKAWEWYQHRSGDAVLKSGWDRLQPSWTRTNRQNVGALLPSGRFDDVFATEKLRFICECFVI